MDFDRLLRPLKVRIANMITRGVVRLVDDEGKAQLFQLGLQDSETRGKIERLQDYGFTSVPLPGAEAVTAWIGGIRDHGFVLAVGDRRYRVRGLQGGEVAVYDHTGSVITLKANGDIEIAPSSNTTKITGDVQVSGTLIAQTDVVGGGKSLKTHVHAAGGTLISAAPGAPVTGSTAAPT